MPTRRNQDLLDLTQPADKKASKPLMEKRRRARINHSLAQLKALVVQPHTNERTRQAKLEKADILELTVRHLYEIKRRQRTAAMVEAGHPKKKFEVGYAECAREVELFLSNLTKGVDEELQKRLQDHLRKRLQDFRDIGGCPKREAASDEEVTSEEPTSNCPDDAEEETDSSDSSALGAMLKYYAGDKSVAKKVMTENQPARTATETSVAIVEEEYGMSFSCPSVSSTTGSKLLDSTSGLTVAEKCHENVPAKTVVKAFAPRECFSSSSCSEASDVSDSPPIGVTLKRKSCLPSPSPTPPTKRPRCQSSDGRTVPLVPRQLANGDWALVLPASLVPNEKEEPSYPFSAFRLVLPNRPTSPERLPFEMDPSAEEDCSRSRAGQGSPDSTQVVWRPW